jgi:hypothetical protein
MALLQFPKFERHVLCAEIRACLTKIIRLNVTAWKREQKAAALFDLDIEIEFLRHLVRKAHRLVNSANGATYITLNRREVWMKHIDEIGSMVGAWKQYERDKAAKAKEARRAPDEVAAA